MVEATAASTETAPQQQDAKKAAKRARQKAEKAAAAVAAAAASGQASSPPADDGSQAGAAAAERGSARKAEAESAEAAELVRQLQLADELRAALQKQKGQKQRHAYYNKDHRKARQHKESSVCSLVCCTLQASAAPQTSLCRKLKDVSEHGT